ncbi:hypothetical protein BGZ80_005788, partial [Entomortierella chlamydospora]
MRSSIAITIFAMLLIGITRTHSAPTSPTTPTTPEPTERCGYVCKDGKIIDTNPGDKMH